MEKIKDMPATSKPLRLGAALSAGGTVVIKVGPEASQRNFEIHKALLSHHSEYFLTALKGPWAEAKEGIVNLDDVEPEILTSTIHADCSLLVDLFATWLYTGTLTGEHLRRASLPRESFTNYDKYWNEYALALVKAYALGERLIAPGFRRTTNTKYNTINESGKIGISVKTIYDAAILAFEKLPSNRIILQSIIEGYCSNYWNPEEYPEDVDLERRLPYEFLRRALRRQQEISASGDRKQRKRCHQEHTTWEEQECSALHMRFDQVSGHGVFE